MLVLASNATGFSLRQGNNEQCMVKKSYQIKLSSKSIQRKLKSKTIGNIRRGKRANEKFFSNMFVFAGTNPAGARSKWFLPSR